LTGSGLQQQIACYSVIGTDLARRLRSNADPLLGAEHATPPSPGVSDGRRRHRRLPSDITVPREQHPIARASSAFFASGTREAYLCATPAIRSKAERPITRAAQVVL